MLEEIDEMVFMHSLDVGSPAGARATRVDLLNRAASLAPHATFVVVLYQHLSHTAVESSSQDVGP